MSTNRSSRFIPIIIAVSVVLGILIGTFYANHFSGNRLNIINTSSNKLNDLLHIIDDQYVDTVNMSDLVEDAMPLILSELDPHSTYIPAKDLEATNADLKGSFSGIGVQFTIQNDTIHINDVIQGGPSAKVGLMPGDRIISVNDTAFVGKKIVTDYVLRKLKGPKGSKVKLGVSRHGEKKIMYFTVVRGDIPVKSIDAAYMLNDKVGYIKINKFGETTYPEMLIALAELHQKLFQGLVIDLRDNTGGYMGVAIQMVNEFLPKNRLIVYTQGRKSPRQEYRSDGRGTSQQIPLVVLVNEGSASASEIFAGAIQDNDRGMIVGRRSFGKGLVQQPMEFRDGSAIRLTIARYYTPSGRCIQKPYVKGHDEDYEMDIVKRYEHGEFFSKDSIRMDESNKYKTRIGRIVYGGGGIMPDLFIPQDTLGFTSYFSQAANQGLIIQYCFQYTDNNRAKLRPFTTNESLLKYLKHQGLLDKFASFAEKRGLKRRGFMLRTSSKLFEKAIYGNILYNMLGMENYVQFLNDLDPVTKKAIEVIDNGKAWPTKSTQPATPAKKKRQTALLLNKGGKDNHHCSYTRQVCYHS